MNKIICCPSACIYSKFVRFGKFCRCRIPGLDTDQYNPPGEMQVNTSHGFVVYNIKECTIQTNHTTVKCDQWVYDHQVYTATIISKVIDKS